MNMANKLVHGDFPAHNIPVNSPGTLFLQHDYASIRASLDELVGFVQNCMVEGEDYGFIEGTKQRTLFKPGADKLCDAYGLAKGEPVVDCQREQSKDGTYIKYVVKLPIVRRTDGCLITFGAGSCNSFETKYRWRWVGEREIAGKYDPATLYSQTKNGKYGEYKAYRIPNDSVDDLDNTILKMASKRAYVDAVISATRSSALFTQDLEDFVNSNQGGGNQRGGQGGQGGGGNQRGGQGGQGGGGNQRGGQGGQGGGGNQRGGQGGQVGGGNQRGGQGGQGSGGNQRHESELPMDQTQRDQILSIGREKGFSDTQLRQVIGSHADGKDLPDLNRQEADKVIQYLRAFQSKTSDPSRVSSVEQPQPSADKAKWITGSLCDDMTMGEFAGEPVYYITLINGPKLGIPANHPQFDLLDELIASDKQAKFFTKNIDGIEWLQRKTGNEIQIID